MQKEQLIFKIVLKFETDQLKTKSTYINQQTPMQNQRSFTELTLDGVQMVPGKIVPWFHRIYQMHLIIMQKYVKVMTTSLEYHMPGVLCTCVLIGHILSSEISIIILSSEIFEIHFDDTIILLYSTTTYFIWILLRMLQFMRKNGKIHQNHYQIIKLYNLTKLCIGIITKWHAKW